MYTQAMGVIEFDSKNNFRRVFHIISGKKINNKINFEMNNNKSKFKQIYHFEQRGINKFVFSL